MPKSAIAYEPSQGLLYFIRCSYTQSFLPKWIGIANPRLHHHQGHSRTPQSFDISRKRIRRYHRRFMLVYRRCCIAPRIRVHSFLNHTITRAPTVRVSLTGLRHGGGSFLMYVRVHVVSPIHNVAGKLADSHPGSEKRLVQDVTVISTTTRGSLLSLH